MYIYIYIFLLFIEKNKNKNIEKNHTSKMYGIKKTKNEKQLFSLYLSKRSFVSMYDEGYIPSKVFISQKHLFFFFFKKNFYYKNNNMGISLLNFLFHKNFYFFFF